MWLLIRKAGAAHGEAMSKVLASADDEEAGRLGAWFSRFPSPAARAMLRERHRDRWTTAWELTLARAGVGDEAAVAWALERLARNEPDDDRWMAIYVLARSPSPDADKATARIIAAAGCAHEARPCAKLRPIRSRPAGRCEPRAP